ncbi:MAG: MFS transporter [Chthonomonadales bacterium]|nr:MFS transporter [Chthonomonadales bacterium]
MRDTAAGANPVVTPAVSERSRMGAGRLFALSAYWLATNLHWGALLLIILPSQVREIAPAHKAEVQGLIVGTGAVVALIVPLVVGALSDRCRSRWGRRRPYMVVGVAVNLAGLAILFSAGGLGSIPLYILGYVVVQLGNNTATGAYSGMIPDLVRRDQRGEASGWMAAMTQTGTILGALLGGFLMGAGQVAASYVAIAGALVLFVSVTALGTREEALREAPAPVDWRGFVAGFWIDPRRYPDFWWVWITRALVTMGMWTVQPFIQYYLADVIGVASPERTAATLMAIILIGATVTGLLGGRLSDRIGRKRVVYTANVIIAAASVGFVFSGSLAVTLVVGMIYGLGYGAYYSVDWALGCDVLPSQENAAREMGVWHISMVLPQSLAAPVGALLLASFGHYAVPGVDGGPVYHYTRAGYTALFSVAAGFLLLGAILLRRVRGVR